MAKRHGGVMLVLSGRTAGFCLAVVAALLFCGRPEICAAQDGPRLRILGFYDVNFISVDSDSRVTSGFSEGQMVLHAISSLTDRTTFFAEVSLSPGSPFAVNVERAILKFEMNNLANLSLGRYHTPVNWWNTAFHHGLWLQTSIGRPEMTRFGARFVPVHFVGLLGQGGVDAGGFSFDYEAGIGNGRSSSVSGAGDAGDSNNNRAYLVHVFVQPDELYQFKLGGSFYHDRIDRTTTAGSALPGVREEIASAYAVFTRETPEVLSEISVVRHQADGAEDAYVSRAYYVQGAYRLPGLQQRLKPYARFEEMIIDHGDPIFHPDSPSTGGRAGSLGPSHVDAGVSVPYLRRYVVGVRADISNFVALKVEYRRERGDSPTYLNGVHSQVSLVF